MGYLGRRRALRIEKRDIVERAMDIHQRLRAEAERIEDEFVRALAVRSAFGAAGVTGPLLASNSPLCVPEPADDDAWRMRVARRVQWATALLIIHAHIAEDEMDDSARRCVSALSRTDPEMAERVAELWAGARAMPERAPSDACEPVELLDTGWGRELCGWVSDGLELRHPALPSDVAPLVGAHLANSIRFSMQGPPM